MRMLVLSPLLYHPTCGNGGGVICFTLLAALARRHEVEFVGFGDSSDTQALQALSAVCKAVHVVPMPHVGVLRRLWRRAGQWRGGMPAEALAFDSAAMRVCLRDIIARFDPELAILQFPYMAQYLEVLKGRPRLVDVQDVFLFSRLREIATQRTRWARAKKRVVWMAWAQYEQTWYRRADALMALAEHDRHALQALAPQVPAFTNPAAIVARPHPAPMPYGGHRVGFGGNFGHPPNVDALVWLNDWIAPLLVRQLPDLEIVVAGKGVPPSLVARLHPCVRLLGFVTDYDEFLASIHVFVAPLRSGGGVKIKVLEALAAARPVVSTAIGAEGIGIGVDGGLFVAASAIEISDAVASVFAALDEHAKAARCGSRQVAERFGVKPAVERLEREACRLTANSTRPRSASQSAGNSALRDGDGRSA